MSLTRLFIIILIICFSQYCTAQSDIVFQPLENLQKVPVKYLHKVENEIDKYSRCITRKTEKTLAKPSKWANKIKECKAVANSYEVKYNECRVNLTARIKYLEYQKDKLNKNLVTENPFYNRKYSF